MRSGVRRLLQGAVLVVLLLAVTIGVAALWLSLRWGSRAREHTPPRLVTMDPAFRWMARGTIHCHTSASDGAGSIREVASAAASAGLAFVIVTDHETRAALPAPRWLDGVLFIPGEELSTDRGHLLHLGLEPLSQSPKRTADEAIRAARITGGLTIAAHPTRRSRPFRGDLTGNGAPAGLEVLNLGSLVKEAPGRMGYGRFAVLAAGSAVAPELALMALAAERPRDALELWDRAALAGGAAIGLAGTDAHGRLPPRWGSRGYLAPFRALSNHVRLDRPLSGEAHADAGTVLSGLAAGRVSLVWDGFGDATGFLFAAERRTVGEGILDAAMGSTRRIEDDWQLVARPPAGAPAGTEMRLLRDGRPIFVTHAGFRRPVREPGAYRLEVWIPARPGEVPDLAWIYSNPIRLVQGEAL